MQFSTAALVAVAATAVSAWQNGTVYTTDVVTAYTTFCPEATTITHGSHTYTATASQTLTITNCPCTVTKPVVTSSVVAQSSAPVYANTSAPVSTAKASATPSPITASSGNKAFALSGASLAGLLGLAAYIL